NPNRPFGPIEAAGQHFEPGIPGDEFVKTRVEAFDRSQRMKRFFLLAPDRGSSKGNPEGDDGGEQSSRSHGVKHLERFIGSNPAQGSHLAVSITICVASEQWAGLTGFVYCPLPIAWEKSHAPPTAARRCRTFG